MKYFLITGVSSGIGEELVKLILEKSSEHYVIGLSRNKPNSSVFEKFHDRIKFFTADFNYPETIEEIFLDDFFKNLNSIDYIVCNAGTLINKPFTEIELKEMQLLYNVNVFSQVVIIQKCIPFMLKSKSAAVVSIGSVGGVTQTKKFSGLSAYSSSKAALSILTECLAEEFSDTNISYNCLALGSVNTKMLKQAFPNYHSQTSAYDMSNFIFDFLTTGNKLINGKTINVSKINT
jgi:3-oxoacyl-[acyl-carrier protein] reductase